MNYISLIYDLLQMRKNTLKNRDEVSKLQKEKLYQMLHYAYDHSKYYRTTFENAGITKKTIDITPIEEFPTINKRILMNNFDELITIKGVTQEEIREFDEQEGDDEVFHKNIHIVHSSGSTGKPGYFIYDEKAWNQMLLAIIRGALWDMTTKDILTLLLKKPKIVYIASTDGRYGGAMAVSSGIKGVRAEQLSLDIKRPLSEWIDEVIKFQPNIIIGYPSAIKILAELVADGKVNVHVERVISCGEPLNSNMRMFLHKVFQCDIINFYGASETLALGVESNEQDGMILFDDMNYVEIIDGKLCFTSLYNFAQPLIRYQLSDHIIWNEEKQDCSFSRIKSIQGRDEDLMWFMSDEGDKDFLHPLSIEGFCIEGMRDYQFKQVGNKQFVLDIELAQEQAKEEILHHMGNSLKEMLKEKHMNYVHFSIQFVKEILPDPKTGKKALIVKQKNREVIA